MGEIPVFTKLVKTAEKAKNVKREGGESTYDQR